MAAPLFQLAEANLDVLIVGGGITGLGTLLECTARGIRAAIIEQGDIASGTSSRSSNLIHGGLRYLDQFRFRLVRQALAERRYLLRSASHLVQLDRFIVPVWGSILQVPYYTAGLTCYDLLGASAGSGRHRWWGASRVRAAFPSLQPAGLRGALMYSDGVTDDARLAVTVARTAICRGGLIATQVRAAGLLHRNGRVVGVRARDAEGAEAEVFAGVVIDATGPWSGSPDHPLGGVGGPPVIGSRGIHLVVPRSRIAGDVGLTIRVPGRVVFLVPHRDDWIIGTTDVADACSPEAARATADDVDYLLDVLAGTLLDAPRAEHIAGVYAGIRPLVVGGASTVTASREHRVEVVQPGLVRISGGKLTTFRVMAHEAVDVASGRRTDLTTEPLELLGSGSAQEIQATRRAIEAVVPRDPAVLDGLIARHGTEAIDVAVLGRELDLLGEVAPGRSELEVELAWAVREELATSLTDVLERRVRLAAALPDRGASIATRAASIVGDEIGWTAGRRARAVDDYLIAARAAHDVPRRDSGAPQTPLDPIHAPELTVTV